MHEMKQHKQWFDEECLGILYQRKQAKMQWTQDPSQSNVDNLNNVRRDASRHFRNKKFGIPKKLVRLIKMCLTETHSRVRVGKNLSETFPIRNGLKQGDALSPLLFNFALERVQVNQGSSKPGWLEIKWYASASGLCR